MLFYPLSGTCETLAVRRARLMSHVINVTHSLYISIWLYIPPFSEKHSIQYLYKDIGVIHINFQSESQISVVLTTGFSDSSFK